MAYYALREGEPKSLEVSWETVSRKFGWKNLVIRLDGMELANIPSGELVTGKEIKLADNSILKFQLIKDLLSISLDGKPIPGSDLTSYKRLRNSYVILFIIGAANFFGGLLSILLDIRVYNREALIVYTIFGALFIGLGFLIKHKMRFAVWIALILWSIVILDDIVTTMDGYSPYGYMFIPLFVVRIVIFVMIYRGAKAIKQIRATA